MENKAGDTGRFARDHASIARTADKLSSIATELDEVSSAYAVEKVASEAEKDPDLVLSELGDMLEAFGRGLRDHFAREERSFPELAAQYDAAELTRSLTAEHREALRAMDSLTERARLLASLEAEPSTKKAQITRITAELKAFLAMLSAHAEKEDEVLFIVDHN